MADDPREKLWQQSYNTYYDVYLEELAADVLIDKWQKLDAVTRVLVVATASGSGVAGWVLWNSDQFKLVWAVIAGVTALLALVHSTLSVPSILKQHAEWKSKFRVLRVELETFQLRMEMNDDFDVDSFHKEFLEFRKSYQEYVSNTGNDLLYNDKVAEKIQNKLDKMLYEDGYVEAEVEDGSEEEGTEETESEKTGG